MMPLKITFTDQYPRKSFIAWAVERNLDWLDAERANRRIVELEIEVLRLQAQIDAAAIREGKDAVI